MAYNKNSAPITTEYVSRDFMQQVAPSLASSFTDRQLWGWGRNNTGQIGDGSNIDKSSPVQVVSGGNDWKQTSTGSIHSAAIKTDGTLWTWGDGPLGRLGTGNQGSTNSPVQTISGGTNWKEVSCGQDGSVAIKTDGTLWTWGGNANGQLGTNNVTHYSSPVQTVSGGTDWRTAASGFWTTAAIKTDGTLWMWGYNALGQLGDETVTNKSSPIQTVAGGTDWRQVALGGSHVLAIKTDGTLWVWGNNAAGQLGDTTLVPKSSPVQTVAGGTNWKQVSCANATSAAIKTDGTLWLWGQNSNGQVGDNTAISKSSPVQTISGGTNWKQVSGGNSHVAAIKTDGTLWTWGSNNQGQLADNTLNRKSSPAQTVAGGTNWKQVSGYSTSNQMMAIK